MKFRIKKEYHPKLLAELYNRSIPLGMGILHYVRETMEEVQAKEILTQSQYIDYLKGRVIKVDFSNDEVDFYLYERDVKIDLESLINKITNGDYEVIKEQRIELLKDFSKFAEQIKKNPTPKEYWEKEQKMLAESIKENEKQIERHKMSDSKLHQRYDI